MFPSWSLYRNNTLLQADTRRGVSGGNISAPGVVWP